MWTAKESASNRERAWRPLVGRRRRSRAPALRVAPCKTNNGERSTRAARSHPGDIDGYVMRRKRARSLPRRDGGSLGGGGGAAKPLDRRVVTKALRGAHEDGGLSWAERHSA